MPESNINNPPFPVVMHRKKTYIITFGSNGEGNEVYRFRADDKRDAVEKVINYAADNRVAGRTLTYKDLRESGTPEAPIDFYAVARQMQKSPGIMRRKVDDFRKLEERVDNTYN
jgi:hypothetical protein